MDFRQEIIDLLVKETRLSTEEVGVLLAIPPDPALGDYAFPCFKLGKNPKEEAEKIKARLKLPSFLTSIKVVGPYLNFFLDTPAVARETLTTITKMGKNYGAGKATKNKTKNIVIEYCGPNTNKPLHLGHLRNMSLGNSLQRILLFQGNKVHPVNIINDRGIHICQSMLAYQKWGHKKKPDKKGDHFVGDYYVLFANELKKNPELKNEAQELLFHWEDKDPQVRALWKKMNGWVLKGFTETYKRFGIAFEKEYCESAYYEQGKEVAFEGLKKGIFEKDDTKAIVAKLESYNLPNKVVLRGDGTSVYITQDLYLAQLRYQDFKFDQLLYVVASEQQVHFQQLFKIMELLERPFARRMYHVSYGLVNLPGGRMKSREGTVVDADVIMDELSALAEQEVRKRYEKLSTTEIKRRAEAISLAALKFFMLKTDAVRDMVFDPQESISFEGETGPYVQYAYARACSILRKSGVVKDKMPGSSIHFLLLQQPQEQQLIRQLNQFPEKVKEAAEHHKPHLLCRYLLDLAQLFNEFYHAHPVISDDKELMNARLLLVAGVRQVLQNGLGLLGIEALEEM